MRRAAAVALVGLAGCGGGAAARPALTPTPTPPQLPGGGRIIFAHPERRIVAFYGNPQDPELGTLGIGSPRAAGKRLLKVAHRYARPGRPVLPAMELLATVANAAPGDDGLYRSQTSDAVIGRYLRAARAVKAELILDIQPGRAAFLPEAQRLERWLRQPDVSLALDPEWHVTAPDLPGQVIGSVDASEVVAVGNWLDTLTRHFGLPQKVLVLHQFTEGMITDRPLLHPYRSVAVVLNTDGFGSEAVKASKYEEFAKLSGFAFNGFKLFYKEDTGLMTPHSVLHLRPPPDMIVYE